MNDRLPRLEIDCPLGEPVMIPRARLKAGEKLAAFGKEPVGDTFDLVRELEQDTTTRVGGQ